MPGIGDLFFIFPFSAEKNIYSAEDLVQAPLFLLPISSFISLRQQDVMVLFIVNSLRRIVSQIIVFRVLRAGIYYEPLPSTKWSFFYIYLSSV